MESTQYDYSQCTPVINRFGQNLYNPFKSAYLNARFNLRVADKYIVKASDIGRLPNISYQFYGTTALWRFICRYNQIADPVSDVYPGRVINLPDLAEVTNLLNNLGVDDSNNYTDKTFTI